MSRIILAACLIAFAPGTASARGGGVVQKIVMSGVPVVTVFRP